MSSTEHIYMGIRGPGGRRVFLDAPKPEDFQVEPIARALANEKRYAGNYGDYSVAQHAVLVARVLTKALGANPPQILAGLHHDDSEAITGDLPKPVKTWLKLQTDAFERLEGSLMDAVDARYQINTRDPLVKKADSLVFRWEVERLVPPDARWMYEPLPPSDGLIIPYTWFVPWSADKAFAAYMDIHEKCVHAIETAEVSSEFEEIRN